MSLKQLFKKTIIIITLLLNVKNIHAQTWEPLTTGLTLTSGTPFVSAMCVYNGKLIVAGNFDNAGGVPVNNNAAWDGSDWSPIGNGISTKQFTNYILNNCNDNGTNQLPKIRSLIVYNNELYVGGDFINVDGIPVYSIAKYNGTNWSTVGDGLIHVRRDIMGFAGINDMTIHNNELYVAGSFDSIGNIAASNLAKWNGVSWSTVGGGIKNKLIGPAISNYSKVWAIHSFNGKLYVGGVFDTVGVNVPAKNITAWDGSNWSTFGSGLPSTGINTSSYLSVTDIIDYMGNIYAGNTTTGISKWNGSYWQSVGGGLSNSSSSGIIYSSLILNNNLIVTGKYSSSGNIQNTFGISSWNGTNWSHFGPTCTVSNISQSGLYMGCITNSVTYNNYLYVAGAFSGVWNTNVTNNGTCVSYTTKNIARLSSPVGIAENEKGSKEIALYPNPATNEIHLSLNHSAAIEKIVVRELSGKEVLSLSIPKTQETIVNTSDLKPGAYFIEIKTNLGILSKPFMKIKE